MLLDAVRLHGCDNEKTVLLSHVTWIGGADR